MGVILDAIEYVMGRAYGSASSGATGIYGLPGAPYWLGKGVRLTNRRLGRAGAVSGGFPVRGPEEGLPAKRAAILIMDQSGTPGEGTRPYALTLFPVEN